MHDYFPPLHTFFDSTSNFFQFLGIFELTKLVVSLVVNLTNDPCVSQTVQSMCKSVYFV